MRRETAARLDRAQADLAEIARQLRGIARRSRKLRRALPDSRERDAMLEDRIPPDLATELVIAVECLLAQHLLPGLHLAERASRWSEASVRREWRRRNPPGRRSR
jgi:hypothetical protein